jgi:hypothetical protein
VVRGAAASAIIFTTVVEEIFVILDGEAQCTIDGRTATVKGADNYRFELEFARRSARSGSRRPATSAAGRWSSAP